MGIVTITDLLQIVELVNGSNGNIFCLIAEMAVEIRQYKEFIQIRSINEPEYSNFISIYKINDPNSPTAYPPFDIYVGTREEIEDLLSIEKIL